MEKYKHPEPYELEEVFANFSSTTFVRNFAKEKGIFMPNAPKAVLAKELSFFFFDKDDISRIHNEAYQKNYKNTLAGFIVNNTESDFELINSVEALISDGAAKDMTIVTPRLISKRNEPEIYKSSITYNRRRLGRMEFLQSENTEFDFYIKKKNDEWLIEVDSKRSKDPSIIRDLLGKHLRRKIEIEEIRDMLTTEKTILFFDALAKQGMNTNIWEFSDVVQLSFKKDKDQETDEDPDSEANEAELAGISKAILDGKNLRENKFVKDSENEGYRFTAMTYEFRSKKENSSIQVKAEFKGNPKVFEVSIPLYGNWAGLKGTFFPSTLSNNEDLNFRSEFWNNAKDIYFKLKDAY
ncbi:hypothetical protein [uncultured Draconibacterium sp.]|uniref:hypothetical protein n=1 Tax=uncultured Draconibacterium sp. TaxID=1573823 RepID=UPI0029C0C964|nr:hypothetical protein [uncultured Draconibacterium sp.]